MDHTVQELTKVTHIIVHEGSVFIDENGTLCSPNGGRVTCEQQQGRLEVTVTSPARTFQPFCGTQDEHVFQGTPQQFAMSQGLPPVKPWGSASFVSFSRYPTSNDIPFASFPHFPRMDSPTCTAFNVASAGFVTAKQPPPAFHFGLVDLDDTNNTVDAAPGVEYRLAPGTQVQKLTTSGSKSSIVLGTCRFLSSDLGILINQGSDVTIPCAEFNSLLVQCFGGTLGVFEAGNTAFIKNLNIVVHGGEVNGLCATQSAVISIVESGAVQCGRTASTNVCRLATGTAQCNLYTVKTK